jgi:hypothetical protein
MRSSPESLQEVGHHLSIFHHSTISKGSSERWTVFNWFAARDDVKKRMAELEERISSLRDALRAAERPLESTKTQRILVIREQELERARVHAQFIDYQIAKVTAKMRRR